jgi:hypothetical protein
MLGKVMHIAKYEWHELGAVGTTATSVHTNIVPHKFPLTSFSSEGTACVVTCYQRLSNTYNDNNVAVDSVTARW